MTQQERNEEFLIDLLAVVVIIVFVWILYLIFGG